MPTYDAADIDNPHLFVAQFLPYLRDLWAAGKLRVDDTRTKVLFDHIEELNRTGDAANQDFVTTGFFESMLHGDHSDQFFTQAAKKYLSPQLYGLFRFTQSGRAGTLEDFLEYEKKHSHRDPQ